MYADNADLKAMCEQAMLKCKDKDDIQAAMTCVTTAMGAGKAGAQKACMQLKNICMGSDACSTKCKDVRNGFQAKCQDVDPEMKPMKDLEAFKKTVEKCTKNGG